MFVWHGNERSYDVTIKNAPDVNQGRFNIRYVQVRWIDSWRPAARPAGRRWRSKTPVLSFCRTLLRFLIRSNGETL